jgi:MFS superfamily sulfate permease-like transporter
VHALTLLVILLVAAPLAAAIPMAVLAAILMVVSYNMGGWREIPELLRLTKADIGVWLATFELTVFADLTVAVEVGMILAALLFIRRVADTTTIAAVTPEYIEDSLRHSLHRMTIPPYVRIFRVQSLQARLDLDQPIVSQQLARLRASGIVVSRKEGTTVYYALAHPRIAEILAVAKAILSHRLTGHRTLLQELRRG